MSRAVVNGFKLFLRAAERSGSGKIGVRWVVKFLYFEKIFEMAIDGKLWQTRVGRQTYSSGIGPRYRLEIYGREMDQTFPQNSCFQSAYGSEMRQFYVPTWSSSSMLCNVPQRIPLTLIDPVHPTDPQFCFP